MAQGQKGSYKNDVKTYFCNKNFNNLSSSPPNNLADNITRNEDNFSVVGTKIHNITENGGIFSEEIYGRREMKVLEQQHYN